MPSQLTVAFLVDHLIAEKQRIANDHHPRKMIGIDAFQRIALHRCGHRQGALLFECGLCAGVAFQEMLVGFALRTGLDQRIHLLLCGQRIGAGQGADGARQEQTHGQLLAMQSLHHGMMHVLPQRD